jgi:hypothetical protein
MNHFPQCRDCKHWMPTAAVGEALASYPRDRRPEDGIFDAVCNRLKRGLEFTASGDWGRGTVDSVETDANFSCAYFESIPENPPT